MTVTFANIQNIAISQRPIQRALGLADLRVDTAGGGAVNTQQHQGQNLHTAWLRGVNNAGEVRQVIQERLRQFKDTGLGITTTGLPPRLPPPTQSSPRYAILIVKPVPCARR